MTSANSEAPPVPKRIYLQTSNLTSDSLDSENYCKDTFLKMDAAFDPFFAEMDNGTDILPGSMSNDALNDNANLGTSASSINRHLFSETPPLENGSGITHNLEYLMSSSEENTAISTKTRLDYPLLSPNRNGDVLFESTNEDGKEIFTISCQPNESLGLVLGMNEIIDASEGEIRKVYVKKISKKDAMNETNYIRLGDEILAINGTHIKNLSRTECLNLLIDLPNRITFLLQRNTIPWTTGPRCSFYLNLVDKNPESILSPAPKLFTNEGKKIPDGYKLLEVSLYREVSDVLGISIVPSYGHTRHYYQIKELDPDGICCKSKLLNKGDFLVSCNGNSLHKIPLNQCLNILKSEGPSLTFEVFRKDDIQPVLQSHETRPVCDDTSEVNNNVNDNNNNDDDSENDDDDRSANSFTSELLVSTEIRPIESFKPVLETNNPEIFLEQTVLDSSDPKLFSDSPQISKLSNSDFEPLQIDGDFPDLVNLSNSGLNTSSNISYSTDISKLNNSDPNASPDFRYSSHLFDLGISNPNTSPVISDFSDLSKLSISDSKPLLDINDSPDLLESTNADPLELSNTDPKAFSDISDFTDISEFNNSDSKPLPDLSYSPHFLDLSNSNSKPSSDISDSTEILKLSISDFKPLPDFGDSSNLSKLSNSDLKTSTDFSDSTGILKFTNIDSKQSHILSDSPDLLGLSNCDFHTSQTISDSPELSRLGDLDSQSSPDIIDSNISKPSSFECELKNTLSKPLLDFLSGSPFVNSSDSLQEPIDACPAEPSPPPVVDETCIQLTAEAEQSSPTLDWSSQLNMSEQSPAEEHFSLDGLEEFSNHFINNANELNNNLNSGYPCSSNEDLISIDTDVLSPVISNPALTFSNHADPWEAAGEAKSETLLPEMQMSQPSNQKNLLNEFIDTVESPDYGLDPLDGLHDNIMQVAQDDKSLLSRPTNFRADVSKGFNLRPSSNTSLYSDFVEEERTSPMSYDDSLYGSIGIHTADEGDIPLSSRNSDNDLIEEMPALSPDSGRADSPGLYKNNSYDQEKFTQKGLLLNLECTNTSDDPDKLTDEENTIYHTISDVSKNTKVSDKHGSFDSSDSCGTSVASFESCAETGEQDHIGTNNLKPFTSRNEELSLKQAKSLPRNAFSNFKEFQTSMKKSPYEKSSKPDVKLFSFNEITASGLKNEPNYGKSDYLNKFSTNLFSRNYRLERKSDQVRTEDKPFQVEVLKGIIGLGMTLEVDDQGFVTVTHVQNNSPIGRNGIIKLGDYILAINNTDIVGVTNSRVQQILRLLPHGLIKVVASTVPISDWKKYTEDAEDPSAGKSDNSLFSVFLTSPIKMSDSSSSCLSGRGSNVTSQKKSSPSFSSALSAFSKDQPTDSAKRPPPTAPKIAPKLSHRNQSGKTETPVKAFGFLNDSKESPPLDKKQTNHNSTYEPSPQSSPEIVLNQVKMFENYFQKNGSSREIKEPVTSSRQTLVQTIPLGNQKPLPEKDHTESLPDILQDHTGTLQKQLHEEVKNSTAKEIAKSYDAGNKTTLSDNCDNTEDFIIPVKSNKYKTFSALPRSSAPRILDSFSMWDVMDSIDMQNQDQVFQLKKTADQVSLTPKDVVKEEVIIAKKKSFVQSLVNQFNSPQDFIRSSSSKISYASPGPKGLKPSDEQSTNQSPKSSVLEETIEPIKNARISNMSKPLPISFSNDEVLIIEKTEKPDTKPNLKMTLTGPYHAAMEVSEPVLEPESKTLSKSMKRPVVPPRKSSARSSSSTPEENSTVSEVKVTEPEVCIGIARRFPQSAVPDCIDIMKIPEMVPAETASHSLEDIIIPQIKAAIFEKYIETPSEKRIKALILLSNMDNDEKYKSALKSSQKQESKGFVSDRTEVIEEEVISCIKGSTSMSAKPRKFVNSDNVIVSVAKNSETLKARDNSQCQENFDSPSSKDLNCESSKLKAAKKKAEVIVKDIIDEAQKELSQRSMSGVENSDMVICDITGHAPFNEKTDSPAQICADKQSDTSKDNITQIDKLESGAEIRPRKLSAQKRSLPLIENGKPKPLPRQSRQLSPSDENNTNIPGEKPKTVHRSLPCPRLKSEIPASSLEANVESSNSSWAKSPPVPFQRSMSPSGRSRNLSERDSAPKVNFFSAPSSPMQEQKPTFFKRTSTSCLESLLNSELQTSTSGRFLPPTPGHYVSRCLPSPPAAVEEYKLVGRSLPSVPVQSSAPSFFGHLVDFKSKTWPNPPTSTKTVSLSVQPQDASLNTSTSLKITNSSEVLPVTSPVQYQETNQTVEKAVTRSSPVPFAKTVSQFTNRVNKVGKPSSPVSFSQKSSTSWTENRQTKQEAPLIMKSPVSPSSAVRVLPLGELKLQSALAKTSFATDASNNKPSDFSRGVSESKSPISKVYQEKTMQNLLPVNNLPEVEPEIATPSSSLIPTSPSKVISVERPISPLTKPPDLQEETLASSLSISTQSSNLPVLPKYDIKSPILSSPVHLVSPSKIIVTENQASSPTASQPALHLDILSSDSSQTPLTSLSPRRTSSTNRKLPDIFQGSHTFKSVSSPVKTRAFSEASIPSENVPIEKSALEHKSQKIVDVSNTEVALSRSISVEPRTASDLTDLKLKSHGIEITENIPKSEVAVSQSINIEPSKSLALSEVKTEKPRAQAIQEVAGMKPTAVADLPERKAKTRSAAVVEEIAKPQVAVSQFIGLKPTTASNLATIKDLKEDKVGISRPETVSMVNAHNVKEKQQNIEILAKVPSPKPEVAVSKFIGLQPTTATGLSEPVKGSRSLNIQKEPTKPPPSSSSSSSSPLSKAKLISTTRPASIDAGRAALLRQKSTDVVILRNPRSGNENNPSSLQGQRYGTKVSRMVEKTRPKTGIFSNDMASVFSKRKWCISTKSGQTNFAIPSEPESIEKVVQLGLIDEEDLDTLLTSANFALDKMSFSNHEEIHIAILEKDATEKIGIRLKKGEKQELGISLLEPDGAAIKQKFIHVGDSLLLVNGKPAWNQTVMDVKVWLQTIETRIILVLCRHPMDEEETANDCEYMDIILRKGVTGIGFCLEGGIGCPLGDRPISVKRIFKGGPAEKGGHLMVGDEILKVNDMDFQRQRHFIAWNHLKFLPEGDVKLHICRRKSQAAAAKSSQISAASTDSEADPSA